VRTTPASGVPLWTVIAEARSMSLRSPGVRTSVPGFIAFIAFGTVIAQIATSRTRRVAASPV